MFFVDNLLVQIHFIVGMIWWTGLAPCEREFPFPGSLISSFLVEGFQGCRAGTLLQVYPSPKPSTSGRLHAPLSPATTLCAAREALKVLKPLSLPSPTDPTTR